MKSACALIVGICVIGVSPRMAAQVADGPQAAAGPLARAITPEALGRLAGAGALQSQNAGPLSWSRVLAIQPGQEILITVGSAQESTRYFVSAGASGLIVVNVTNPALAPAAARWLRDMAVRHSGDLVAVLAGRGVGDADAHIRLGINGFFVDGARVAALDQVLERIARDAVTEISGPMKKHGSVKGAIAGVVFGLVLDMWTALPIIVSDKPCGGGCGGRELEALGIGVSIPTALGWLAYRASTHQTSDLIYRR